jgi:hypothetical protein
MTENQSLYAMFPEDFITPVCRHNRPISARFLGSSALARFDNYTLLQLWHALDLPGSDWKRISSWRENANWK